jgi:hypothetical protein
LVLRSAGLRGAKRRPAIHGPYSITAVAQDCASVAHRDETQPLSEARVIKLLTLQNLFCTNRFIPRFNLGLVEQDHVQQGIMHLDFSVIFDKTQFAEFVHEKAHARSLRAE